MPLKPKPSAREDKKEKPTSNKEEKNGEPRVKNTTLNISLNKRLKLMKRERPEMKETSMSPLKPRLPSSLDLKGKLSII